MTKRDLKIQELLSDKLDPVQIFLRVITTTFTSSYLLYSIWLLSNGDMRGLIVGLLSLMFVVPTILSYSK